MHAGSMGKILSMDARGRFGFSGGFGRLSFGDNRFGYYSWYAGIYQKKYYFGKPYISRQKFYRPRNPQTELQQAWRAVVTSGWDAYNELTTNEKNEYKRLAKNRHMSGANFFMSEWLKAHRSVLG